MPEKIIIEEKTLVSAIKQFVDECDSDELARIAGEIFGGKCLWSELDTEVFSKKEYYSFEPNDFYGGGLDNLA